MFKRTRYKHGCLTKEERKSGAAVWIYRWRETDVLGKLVQRKRIVGTIEEYPTIGSAEKAVEGLRVEINKEAPQRAISRMTVSQLIAHFTLKELDEENERRTAATKEMYRLNCKNWIEPRWGKHLLTEVRTVAVEDWLVSIDRANATKSKIRNMMSALFNHAIRNEWLDARNPIALVRQSAKRERIPVVLEHGEIFRLIKELDDPYRSMVFLAAATGLRASELVGLKWGDIDFDALQINLKRSVVQQVVGNMKTEASRKPIPLDASLAEALLEWRGKSEYSKAEDWLFASPEKAGTQPYWPNTLLRNYVRTAAARCGIQKQIGWHTFRHSYATLLKANGEDIKVVQEALRHANSRITMDTYTQAVTSAKRQAQSKVVEMIMPTAMAS